MTYAKENALFEIWAREKNYDLRRGIQNPYDESYIVRYSNTFTECAHNAWQGRAAIKEDHHEL